MSNWITLLFTQNSVNQLYFNLNNSLKKKMHVQINEECVLSYTHKPVVRVTYSVLTGCSDPNPLTATHCVRGKGETQCFQGSLECAVRQI